VRIARVGTKAGDIYYIYDLWASVLLKILAGSGVFVGRPERERGLIQLCTQCCVIWHV
jgi:hypothetical protein